MNDSVAMTLTEREVNRLIDAIDDAHVESEQLFRLARRLARQGAREEALVALAQAEHIATTLKTLTLTLTALEPSTGD